MQAGKASDYEAFDLGIIKYMKSDMGEKMKRKIIKLSAVLLSGAISLNTYVYAMAAQSPEFSRSDEEWAALKDNKLEYSEIADLIHEYNPTVANNNYEYKNFVDTYGNTNEEIASEYRSKASDILNNISGSDDAQSVMSDAQAELSAKQLNQQADNNTEDSTTKSLSYKQSEAQLVMTAKSYFIQYYSSQNELEEAKTRLSSLQSTLELTSAKVSAGMLTESDLRTAKKNVSDQESSVKKAEEAVEETRQKLIVMLGWSASDTPEIGALPEVTAEMVGGIDLEGDIAKAKENNYTLSINKKKLSNAKDSDNISVLNSTIEGNEKSIAVSVNSAYQTLKNALMNLDTAKLSLSTEEKNMDTAERRYQAGLSTKYDYNQEKCTLSERQQAVKAAEYNLISAYMSYESYVNGLANAG